MQAFDAYDQASHGSALSCLKYMALCKVLNDTPGEVSSLMASKFGMRHAGPDMEAMAAIARAAKARSLEDFEAAVARHEPQLKGDALIAHHLDLLYARMLEGNLLRIVHPFSCVEIAHVARLINLPEHSVRTPALLCPAAHGALLVLSVQSRCHGVTYHRRLCLTVLPVSLCPLSSLSAGGPEAVPDDPGPQVQRHPGPGPRAPDRVQRRGGRHQLRAGGGGHGPHGAGRGDPARARQGTRQGQRVGELLLLDAGAAVCCEINVCLPAGHLSFFRNDAQAG